MAGLLDRTQPGGLLDEQTAVGLLTPDVIRRALTENLVASPPSLSDKLKTTWPPRLAEGMLSGLTVPGDVYAGRVSMMGPDGRTNPEVIDRAAELSGAVMSGGMPMAQRGALGMAGGRPRATLPMDEASRMARADAMR